MPRVDFHGRSVYTDWHLHVGQSRRRAATSASFGGMVIPGSSDPPAPIIIILRLNSTVRWGEETTDGEIKRCSEVMIFDRELNRVSG